MGGGGGGGGYSHMWARYVPQDGVWFLRFLILKLGINFAHVGIVFLVCSLDRVPKFYQLPSYLESVHSFKKFSCSSYF